MRVQDMDHSQLTANQAKRDIAVRSDRVCAQRGVSGPAAAVAGDGGAATRGVRHDHAGWRDAASLDARLAMQELMDRADFGVLAPGHCDRAVLALTGRLPDSWLGLRIAACSADL